jgi:2-succinyl-5-enolpyruvyl-6-hydroxy-3-cyclohexene-1-carboxylate synthase
VSAAVNASQALALTLVDELARGGVRHACLSPGSRSAPLALALADDERISLHVLLDERSAGFAALGIAKAARAPALVLTTSGTAAANLHPAVLEAHHARTPLLVITADRPPELRDTGATQTIDQLRLFGDAVRWFAEVGAETGLPAPALWRSVAARACIAARSSPPGPVHLNVPLREPLVPIPEEGSVDRDAAGAAEGGVDPDPPGAAEGAPWTASPPSVALPPVDDLEALAAEIGRRERGLLVAGACDVDSGPVLALARLAGWPVLAEPASNLRRGDGAVAHYDALLRVDRFRAEHTPDLVLRVGSLGVSKELLAWLGRDVPQVLVDIDGAWLDARRAVRTLVRADAGALCAALGARVRPRAPQTWLESWRRADARARAAIEEVLSREGRATEPAAARDLAAALPDGSTLVVAASMSVRDLDWFMAPRAGLRVLANRGANGIDGFTSTALGAALAAEGPVAALCGDLSLLHDQNGLLFARDARPDAVLVVLNNDGGGVFSFLPQAAFPEHFEELFGTPQGVDLEDLARLHALGYARAERRDDLAPALHDALGAGGTHLVEIATDRAANVELHRRIWDAVEHALDA